MKPVLLTLFLFLTVLHRGIGQESLYAPDFVHEVRISFSEPDWRAILDSLFEHTGDAGRLKGEVEIDGNVFPDAGIRYKGYSSYNTDELKNPLNIDLDYYIKNRNHQGYVKLKLGNVIHDPSFIREVLAYEIARKYMPAPNAGYANVFVNDTLIGLYTNVEAVDRQFTARWWGNSDHPFFKGEPLKLMYPFGQNSNLALTHGSDSSGYLPFYSMESETGWNLLVDLITKLDAGAAEVAGVLDIDRALWMHAFNEVIVNLDSYIGYSQNYYLCRDDFGRFHTIPWDLNMSFGSFRDSDGSTHFTGLSVSEAETLDPMALLSFAVSPRPLMTKLFENQSLQRKYIAHMRTILDQNVRNGWYFQRGQELQDIIAADVATDTNRFYPLDDFRKNLSENVGGTGGMLEYPGIRSLMEARLIYLDSLDGFTGYPESGLPIAFPTYPRAGDSLWITVRVSGAATVTLGFTWIAGQPFQQLQMYDDGNHQDSLAGDGTYGAGVKVAGLNFRYYIYAENSKAGTFSPPEAEFRFYTIQCAPSPGDVVVNEVYTGNGSGSWFELFNRCSDSIATTGMTLTDDRTDPQKWRTASTMLPPRHYLVPNLQTTGNRPDAELFTGLNPAGGTLFLFDREGTLIDSLTWGALNTARSCGRMPNGYGAPDLMIPTPMNCNRQGGMRDEEILIYPNPTAGDVNVETTLQPPLRADIRSVTGTVLGTWTLDAIVTTTPSVYKLSTKGFSSGLYLLSLSNPAASIVRKLVIRND